MADGVSRSPQAGLQLFWLWKDQDRHAGGLNRLQTRPYWQPAMDRQ